MKSRQKMYQQMQDVADMTRKEIGLSVPITLDVFCRSAKEIVNCEERKNQSDDFALFTLARKLGHRILHDVNNENYSGIMGDDEYIEANEFAACLLMPKKEFTEYCTSIIDQNHELSIEQVAGYFHVPLSAAKIRGCVFGMWNV